VKLHGARYTEEHDRLEPIVLLLLMPLAGMSYLVRTSRAGMILMGFLLAIGILSWYSLVYYYTNHA